MAHAPDPAQNMTTVIKNNNRKPPLLSQHKSYSDWTRLVKLWQKITDLPKDNHGAAIVMTLEGKSLDAVLELTDDDINKDTGVDLIIAKLDPLYKKDELNEKFEHLEKFESYKRPSATGMQEFLNEFDKLHALAKKHGANYSDDILGFKLIKSANLQNRDEQLIKATIQDIKYADIKSKIKKIFCDNEKPSNSTDESFAIKSEPTFYTREDPECYNGYDDDLESDEDNPENTFYTPYYQNRRGGSRGRSKWQPRGRNFSDWRQPSADSRNTPEWRQSSTKPNGTTWRKPSMDQRPSNQTETHTRNFNDHNARNPMLKNGQPTRCNICQSINHWRNDCPDKLVSETTYLVNEVVLHNCNDVVLKSLVAETWCSAVLDSGATSTVCGNNWFNEFLASLPDEEIKKVSYCQSNKPYKFGDGKCINAVKSAKIPAHFGNNSITIQADIVDAEIPLLLSNSSMKRLRMSINFDNDTAHILGSSVPLATTSAGLYALPITKPVQLLHSLDKQDEQQITLTTTHAKTNSEIASKLHRCFAHPSPDKIIKLVNSAGPYWSQNSDLKHEIKKVSENCDVCKIYRKAPPRPIVSLPMCSSFQEIVAMDLKQYQGKLILHMIDLCTRLSAAAFIPNKSRGVIVQTIFRIWISVYGSPAKFMNDNGGEFANAEFLEMCEQLNITPLTTAAESPWSNGIVERNNQTLACMMNKIIHDANCSPEMALCWALNAKNSLQNVAGFSPFQLAIGFNPNLPSTINDKLPSLSNKSSSQIISDNLDALHSARCAFIEAENNEKIRRSLMHNVRSSGEVKYVTGDDVYYKRDESQEWHGPGKVIGQVGQQVFVKHGSFYIRVHPCRLQFVNSQQNPLLSKPSKENIHTDNSHNSNNATAVSDDDDDDEQSQLESQPPAHVITDQEATRPLLEQTNTNKQTDVGIGAAAAAFEKHGDGSAGSSSPSRPKMTVDNTDHSSNSTFKQNQAIRYKDVVDDPWTTATLVNRAGKASGRHKNWWNISCDDGTSKSIDVSQKIIELVNNLNAQSEVQTEYTFITKKDEELEAKYTELNDWENRQVYTEVEDTGQSCISLRWVVKEKPNENPDKKSTIKARLCARGFEEEKNFRTDSPTCSREGLRIALALIASNKWDICSLDVKTAFLQGNLLERTVYVRPPKEAQTTKIWLLNKCVYGLGDASRYWYLKVREVLTNLGAIPSTLDQGLFTFYKDQKLIGILVLFVDDIIYAGQSNLGDVIDKFKSTFQIGSEGSQIFDYVGIHLEQHPDKSITIDQQAYVSSLKPIFIPNEQNDDPLLTLDANGVKSLRGLIGQLNWLANITRPEISYDVSRISSNIKSATIADVKWTNKVLKFVQTKPAHIHYPSLQLQDADIVVYTDASFNNNTSGSSQGAHIVFLRDSKNACPIAWRSSRIRRIARSTLAAETLAFADGCDTASFIKHLATEIKLIRPNLPFFGKTDSKSLFDAANTTTLISDRRLRVEISLLREMQETDELKIQWISKEYQLADVMTKTGASSNALMSALQKGRFE